MRVNKVKPTKFNTSFLNNNINKVLEKYDTSNKGVIKSIFFRLKKEDFEILKEIHVIEISNVFKVLYNPRERVSVRIYKKEEKR